MAQLRDTYIEGDLTVSGRIYSSSGADESHILNSIFVVEQKEFGERSEFYRKEYIVRKWSNGIAELWCTYVGNVTLDSEIPGLGYTNEFPITINYPDDLFIETPRCFTQYQGCEEKIGGNISMSPYTLPLVVNAGQSALQSTGIKILNISGAPDTGELVCTIDFYAIGKCNLGGAEDE